MDLIKQIVDGAVIVVSANDIIESKATPIDVIPQERFTGDVLKGRGPRRGNLERLLRYWRPIMKKPGGFRRCRVILADHPELYPLENICAWLHHETTGLWPNEGCHHPNMKNCKKKLKKITAGSIWTDKDFDNRMRKLTSRQGRKSMQYVGAIANDEPFTPVITEADWDHAFVVLQDFCAMESDFVKMLEDESNWEHEEGYEVQTQFRSLDENNIKF